MDPAAAAIAMEQMNKMTPQQRQQMMDSMKNMDPAMMQAAMGQMKNMKADDWSRAREQMRNMDPDTIAQQSAQMGSQLNAQQQYAYNASVQLKNEGNRLHGAGQYAEAAEKYERAQSNLASHTSSEAADVRRACTLNLCSCYLNLKQYDACVKTCTDVLATDADSVKALYRRGQALMGLRRWSAAVPDLQRAAQLSAHDPAQLALIRDKLQEAKDMVHSERLNAPASTSGDNGSGPAAADGGAAAPLPQQASASQAAAADISVDATKSRASVPQSMPQGFPSLPGPNGMTPEMMKQTADLLRQNPDMVKQAQSMMSGMSSEQLRSMARQAGLGDIDPEVLRTGPQQMDGITPDMIEMAANMHMPPSTSATPAAPSSSTVGGSSSSGSTGAGAGGFGGLGGMPPGANSAMMAQAAEMMANNPEMMKMAADMFGSMPAEQLEQLSARSGFPGAAGGGPKLTPELAKMAAESLSKMSPAEMQRMAQMAAAQGIPGGTAVGAGGPVAGRVGVANPASLASSSSPPSTSGQVSTCSAAAMAGGMSPDMAKMAMEMMSSMKPEDMANMQRMAASMGAGGEASTSGAAAGGLSPEMAKMAMGMMSSMKPEDIANMQRMAASMGAGGGMGMGGLGAAFGGGGVGGAPPAESARMMESMMQDPKMIETMISMVQGMDPASLSSMFLSSGMNQQQADAMAARVKTMSPTQAKLLARAATVAQTGWRTYQRSKAFVTANKALVAAVVLLILAVLLRYWGIM